MGTLKIDVIEAKNLIAADPSGFSDPYVTLALTVDDAGTEIKKQTKTKMQTLEPKWNETITFSVDYKAQPFMFRVWDWDRLSANDPLGNVKVDLGMLRDGQEEDLWLKLEGVEHGDLHVKMLWTPKDPATLIPVETEHTIRRPNELIILKDENRRLKEALIAAGGNPADIPPIDKRTERLLAFQEMENRGFFKIQTELVDTSSEKIAKRIHSNRSLTFVETSVKIGVFASAGSAVDAADVKVPWEEFPPTTFGDNMRCNFFVHKYFFNSASYGVMPRPVVLALKSWEEMTHADPVVFRLKTLPMRLNGLVSKLATWLRADPNDFTFIINTTSAISAVLKSITWRPGDRLVFFHTESAANKRAFEWVRRYYPVELVEISVPLPETDDHICQIVSTFLEKHVRIAGRQPRLACFSHVTSDTGFIFPARRLVSVFHKHKIPVLVDGTLAIGNIPVNTSEIFAEYYAGSFDRWGYAPPGASFLIAQPHCQQGLTTLTVSYNYGHGFEQEFQYYGLQDFSHYLAIEQSFFFVKKVCGGWKKSWEYCNTLAVKAVKLLEEAWGTKVFQGTPDHYGRQPIMPLPRGQNLKPGVAPELTAYLMANHNITAFFVVLPVKGVPTLCVRLTINIYNTIEEIQFLAKVIKEMTIPYNKISVIQDIPSDAFM
eukprot:TRINITY_DN81_c0_g1_i6.p1 TRINITY_DN81_c0_g1~~TRINITY_DN81_c0_g1_i6.p1  ORF type:complete len:677 (-),score=206.96 TRINITY_DN81_c0_g1_i6:74-2050(-)